MTAIILHLPHLMWCLLYRGCFMGVFQQVNKWVKNKGSCWDQHSGFWINWKAMQKERSDVESRTVHYNLTEPGRYSYLKVWISRFRLFGRKHLSSSMLIGTLHHSFKWTGKSAQILKIRINTKARMGSTYSWLYACCSELANKVSMHLRARCQSHWGQE